MRARGYPVLISSALFTIALLSLVHPAWTLIWDSASGGPIGQMDGWKAEAHFMWGRLGSASLTIICIGLIATWMGYFKNLAWTWFLMALIVGGWAVPFIGERVLFGRIVVSWRGVLQEAINSSGAARSILEDRLIFTAMTAALILPAGSLLKRFKGSTRLKGSTRSA